MREELCWDQDAAPAAPPSPQSHKHVDCAEGLKLIWDQPLSLVLVDLWTVAMVPLLVRLHLLLREGH